MKSHRQSIRTTLEEVELDGREATIEFTRVTVTSHDPNADCDADGNRGHAVDDIDEDYAEDVTVQCEGEDAQPLDALPEGTRALVLVAIDTYLATHEPEWQEEEEPDPDDERERRLEREADRDDWRRER